MLKSFSSKTCAFDCEWAPCPATARRLLGLPATTTDSDAINAVWKYYATPESERPFLKLVLSKVLTIAAVFRYVTPDGSVNLELYARTCDQAGEASLIHDFLERVASDHWQLWGYSSASADLPILKQRAIALDVPLPDFSKRPNKPWEGMDYHDVRGSEAHKDILDLIGAYGSAAAKPKLHELAVACGLPGKLDVAGDEVAEMYLNGRMDDILQYNETDAVTTHLVMLRLAHVSAKLDDDAYRRELEAVEALVEAQIAMGKRQFVKFLAVWKGAPLAADVGAATVASADPDRARRLWADWKAVLAQVKAAPGGGLQSTAALQAVRDVEVRGDQVILFFGTNEFSRNFCEKKPDGIVGILAQTLELPAVTLVCELGDLASRQNQARSGNS